MRKLAVSLSAYSGRPVKAREDSSANAQMMRETRAGNWQTRKMTTTPISITVVSTLRVTGEGDRGSGVSGPSSWYAELRSSLSWNPSRSLTELARCVTKKLRRSSDFGW